MEKADHRCARDFAPADTGGTPTPPTQTRSRRLFEYGRNLLPHYSRNFPL